MRFRWTFVISIARKLSIHIPYGSFPLLFCSSLLGNCITLSCLELLLVCPLHKYLIKVNNNERLPMSQTTDIFVFC